MTTINALIHCPQFYFWLAVAAAPFALEALDALMNRANR